MSKHSQTSKPSRRHTSRDSDNTVSDETSTHSAPEASITSTTLHKTPHAAVERHTELAQAAYHLAEQRGFAPGHELDDWFTAEVALDQRLAGEGRAY